MADNFAKRGRILKTPYQDIFNQIKKSIWNDWSQEWKAKSKEKGIWYTQIVEELPKKNWFHSIPSHDRYFITATSQIRSGHTRSPKHLYKININDNPYCSCGEIGDLDHIFLGCPNYIRGTALIHKVWLEKTPSPCITFTDTALHTHNTDIYTALHNHIKLFNLKL